ncbi:PREDICTED: monocarboxylate transporter 9-like [Priapulus caudatus]|uniref:Monocarboxylate transporter 9-like n=1 Tax=Priapulus caudatus TaxID=37621 RepID=A0ABM1F160_PRICU|nr:PREDICTED: monocarboxylate transporter 9-like [Priapulus caudatus]
MPVDSKATEIIANSSQHEGMDASKNTGSRASKVLTHTDHGWAWVVLLGSCINAFVLGNAEACFSVLFVEFITVFAEKRNVIALVGSLQTGITLIAGPVFSRLAEEYGYRLVIVTGGMLATGGMCLSYGAENLTVLIGAYGMLTGGVFGLLFLAAGKLWVFSLCCVLYGASYGIKLSIQTPILVDLFGIQHLPTVQSLYYLFNGIGAIMGSLVAVIVP